MIFVNAILPLALIVALGYVLRRRSFFPEDFSRHLNRLVLYVALPSLLLLRISDVEVRGEVFVQASLAYVGAAVATALLTFFVVLRLPRNQRGVIVQSSFRTNLAYLGFPLALEFYGNQILPAAAALVSSGIVFNTVLAYVVLSAHAPGHEGGGVGALLVRIFRSPIILAVLLGLLFSVTGSALPKVVRELLGLLGRLSLPAVLLVIGANLSFRGMRRHTLPVIAASLAKLAVMPGVAFLLTWFVFGTEWIVAAAVTTMCAMPTAATAQSFAGFFEADETLQAATVSLTTIAAGAAIPLWVLLLQ